MPIIGRELDDDFGRIETADRLRAPAVDRVDRDLPVAGLSAGISGDE